MTTLRTLLVLLLLSLSHVLGDGYPFDTTSGTVFFDTLRFQLTDEQLDELSATGNVSFSEAQLRTIQQHYPKFPKCASVITTTHNDGLDVVPDHPVYCFWTAADEVSVTLPNRPADTDFDLPEPQRGEGDVLRLSPKGHIYYRGKRLTLDDAFEVIRAACAKQPDGPFPPGIGIVLPPPFRHQNWVRTDIREVGGNLIESPEGCNERVKQLYATFRLYAESKGGIVAPSW